MVHVKVATSFTGVVINNGHDVLTIQTPTQADARAIVDAILAHAVPSTVEE